MTGRQLMKRLRDGDRAAFATVRAALRSTNGHVVQAAGILQCGNCTLYRVLWSYPELERLQRFLVDGVREAEGRRLVALVLKRGSISAAARKLGWSRQRLHKRLQVLGKLEEANGFLSAFRP